MQARPRFSLLLAVTVAAGLCAGTGARAQSGTSAVLEADTTLITGAISPARPAEAGPAHGACGGARKDWLNAMIGQMLMFGFEGTSPGEPGPRRIARQLCDGTIGGVILLGNNVKSAAQVRSLTRLFRRSGAAMTPLIAVDQEGGEVQRLGPKAGYRAVPRAATMASRHSADEAFRIYNRMALQVRTAGFNVNLGPVVDVNVYANNPIIGGMAAATGATRTR